MLAMGLAEEDDAQLVTAVREDRSDAAARVLFDRYAALVRRILQRTLGPAREVEDQLQETFLAFFRQLGELRSDGSARAYLVSIAIRIARSELRRRRLRRILRLTPAEELVELAGNEDPNWEARRAVSRLFAILDELDTDSRLAFALRHIEEMELTDVASALGISLATVKRRLTKVEPIVRARLAGEL
jgi:RNA polymerase sigma-70 factor (ECF subfamily)